MRKTIPSETPNKADFVPFVGELGNAEIARRLYEGITVVDIPGCFDLFETYLAQYLKQDTIAVVLVVDATDRDRLPEAAQMLMKVIGRKDYASARTSLCLVLNKLDSPNARNRTLVLEQLEREVELARRQGSVMEAADIRPSTNDWITKAMMAVGFKPTKYSREDGAGPCIDAALNDPSTRFKFNNITARNWDIVQHIEQDEKKKSLKGFIQKTANMTPRV